MDMFVKCAECHLFVEKNYTDGDTELAEYIHLDRGDEADEAITETHDAQPSEPARTLEYWQEFGPLEMKQRFGEES